MLRSVGSCSAALAVALILSACTAATPVPSASPAQVATSTGAPTSAAAPTATAEPTPPILAHYEVLLPSGTVQVLPGWTNLVALEARRDTPLRRIHVADTPDLRWRVVHETNAEIREISGRDRIITFVEVRPTARGSEHVVVLLDAYAGNTRELDRSVLSARATQLATTERSRPRALAEGGFVAWTKWIEGADGSVRYELYDLPAHIPGARPRTGPTSADPLMLLHAEPVTFLTHERGVDRVVAYGSTGYQAPVIEAPYVEAVTWAGAPIAAVGDRPGTATRIVRASFGAGAQTEVERAPDGERCTDLRGSGSWASWRCRPLSARLEAWNGETGRKVFVGSARSPLYFEARHNLFFWTEDRGGQVLARIAHMTHR